MGRTILADIRKNCKICGNEFRMKNHNHKYCSIKCQKTALNISSDKLKKSKFIIFERDNFTCFYCGKNSYQHNIILQIDHVIPRNKYGEDTAENLVTSCSECNYGKNYQILAKNNIESIQSEIKRRNNIRNIGDKIRIKGL
jgi:5-methylcytosine-specific restriction endonuclease McrA